MPNFLRWWVDLLSQETGDGDVVINGCLAVPLREEGVISRRQQQPKNITVILRSVLNRSNCWKIKRSDSGWKYEDRETCQK